MLKLSSIALLVATALGLSACAGGFKPLYGVSAGTVAKLASLTVQEQKSRVGQLARNEILDGAGLETPNYTLALSVTESTNEISRLSSSSAARNRLTLRAHYELQVIATHEALTAGDAVVNVEYDLIKVPVSDLQSVEYARVRAGKLLGRDIKQRLAAALASHTD